MRYCIILLMLIVNFCYSQSFTTKVSQNIIGMEDVLGVDYIADNVEIDQFNLPRFANWTLVAGPNLSTSQIVSGSNSSTQTIYSVMLKPKVNGVIVVPGAVALINNKPQRSNQVSIQVKNVNHVGNASAVRPQTQPSLLDLVPDYLPATQTLKEGEDPVEKIKRNLFVRLEVNKQNCYVGEPVTAVYKLFTRLKSKSKIIKQPTFSGCTVVELTGDYQDQHLEKIDGVDYNVFVIRKVQLIPLDSGQITLPIIQVENEVMFHTSSGSRTDLFGNPVGPVEKHVVNIQSKPHTIHVSPLPSFKGNGVLSGAIGDFSISIQPVEDQFTTSGANHLMVIIQGTGNLQQVKMPVMNWPKGIESFEAADSEQIDKQSNPVVVKKVFTIPFSAEKEGNYILPQVLFTYFDPNKKIYVNKATPSFLLKVVSASSHFSNTSNFDNTLDFDQRLMLLLGTGIVAVLIGLGWYNYKQKSKPLPEVNPVIEDVPEIKPMLNEPPSAVFLHNIIHLEPTTETSFFYKQLHKNLCNYISSRFSIQPSEIEYYAKENIAQSDLLLKLNELINQCTFGMYTPVFGQEQALKHRLQAIELIESLDKRII